MTALVGVATDLRAILASHVALQLMDSCRFGPTHDIQRDRLVRIATKAFDFEIETADSEYPLDSGPSTISSGVPPARWPERRANSLGNVGTFVGTVCRQFGTIALICSVFVPVTAKLGMQKALQLQGLSWSEREDLNLRPLVSQTSALTGLRHAPMPFP